MLSIYAASVCLLAVNIHATVVPPRDLVNSLALTKEHKQDAFDALNVNRDEVINTEDLDIIVYYKEAGYVKKKFLDMIDIKTKDGKVTFEELDEFLNLKHVILAVWECSYVHSKHLRGFCLSDQIMTYIMLVIDDAAIHKLWLSIEDPQDDNKVIDCKEVSKLAALNDNFTPLEQENFLIELGGEDKQISAKEFREYVLIEDLQDDFRLCRKNLKGCLGEYDDDCLKKKLIDYTMNHLTDLDIGSVFNLYDSNTDTSIEKKELVEKGICSEEIADRLISMMDKTGDNKVTYGEMRTFMRCHTVKLHLERDCSQAKATQDEEIACYKEKIEIFADENHTPILLQTPDLDMLFLFEYFDTNDDGVVKVMDDLVNGMNWDLSLAKKLVAETDGRDGDKVFCLEEFNERVDEPNLVYALADCLSVMRGIERLSCYESELKDLFTHMLEETKVKEFFESYDKDNNNRITKNDLDVLGIEEGKADNLLRELGMGDMTVTHYEFYWYVRQQDISHLFSGCDKSIGALQLHLLEYTEEFMTQHEIVILFRALDTNNNWEIECSDFGAASEKVTRLLAHIDLNGDNKVHYVEFWLWLMTPINDPKKKHLDTVCAKEMTTQEKEIDCYKKEIFNMTPKAT